MHTFLGERASNVVAKRRPLELLVRSGLVDTAQATRLFGRIKGRQDMFGILFTGFDEYVQVGGIPRGTMKGQCVAPDNYILNFVLV